MASTHTRDLFALIFAGCGALLATCFDPGRLETWRPGPVAQLESAGAAAGDAEALSGLLDAEEAVEAGSWWLDEPHAEAELSFAPEHDRLVWRVRGCGSAVLLDATTGDALGFEYAGS